MIGTYDLRRVRMWRSFREAKSAHRRAACVIVKPHKETISRIIPKTQLYQMLIKEPHMRKYAKATEQEIREGPQTVSFQIANGNARQTCSLKTKFPTQEQAKKYLLVNWPTVEKMARDVLATGSFEDGQIKLVML
jgi:hypothetical protein